MRWPLLSGFFLRTILWLLVNLIVWLALSPWLVLPIGWGAAEVMKFFFPWASGGYQFHGEVIDLFTSLKIPDPLGAVAGRVALASPEANYKLYGFSLPLFLALIFATRPHNFQQKVAIGLLVLLPFQVFGIVFSWLKQIAIDLNDVLVMQTGFDFFDRQVIALMYQLSSLLLPTLIPIILWLILDQSIFLRLYKAPVETKPVAK